MKIPQLARNQFLKFKSTIKNSFLKIKTINWKHLAKQKSKDPIFWARFSAYAIPLTFLLYVLYMNFLPFGYHETFTIDVGSPNDTDISEFYLEPSKDLSDRLTTPSGFNLRELDGSAVVVFRPKAILTDAEITVSTEDEGVFIMPPVINFDPTSIDWDYSWDFTEKVPEDLTGNAFIFDGATYFDGKSRLELPNSADKFENGPFTVYVEWEPRDSENNTQQIVGHYNWELWQNKNTVEFRVGRMNDGQGPDYSLKYSITEEFFNKKHTAVAVYNPSENGYIEFFVDGNSAGKTDFGIDKIWEDYGDQNLSLGWTPHHYNKSPHFSGYIYKVHIISKNILSPQSKINFKVENNDSINISLMSLASTTLTEIKLYVIQK